MVWAFCSSQNTPVDLTAHHEHPEVAMRLKCSWLESESLRGETPHSKSETFLVSFGMIRKHHVYNSKYVYDMAVNWGVGHLYCFRSTGINYFIYSWSWTASHIWDRVKSQVPHATVVSWWIHQPVIHLQPDRTADYLSAVLALQGRVPGRNWGKNKESQRATYLPLRVPSELW